MHTLTTSSRSFDLTRAPKAPNLRAWDAADEYVVAHLDGVLAAKAVASPASIMVVGDSFGALSCALDSSSLTVINESSAGREAIELNRRRNGLEPIEVCSILDLATVGADSPDAVVIKVPKSNAELEETLHLLRPHLGPDTVIVGAGMAKHIRTASVDAFEQLIGPTTTSLAKKKARLIHATFDSTLDVGANPWPNSWKAHGVTLVNHGRGFSPKSLDSGTGFLLDSLSPEVLGDMVGDIAGGADPLQLVDLGCGNGIIGLVLSQRLAASDIESHVTAIDDSAPAIAAARASWDHSGGVNVSFHHAHRMVEVCEPASVELVVVNPPFHADRVIGDETAWSMFVDAHKVLVPGGRLVVVANRHLAYHAKLNKIFGNVDNVASNTKFVALSSTR